MLEIPYITDKDIERWANVLEKSFPVLKRDIELGNTQNGRRYYQLFREYLSLGLTKYCQGDIPSCRKAFRASAAVYLDLLQRFKAGKGIKPGLISYIDCHPMLLALMAGDTNLARQLAIEFGCYVENGSESEFFKNIGLAIKYIILDQPEEALSLIEQSIDIGFAGSNKLAYLVKSLVEDDDVIFEKRLSEALCEFDDYAKNEANGTPEAAIFVDGLGLVALRSIKKETKFMPKNSDIRLGLEILDQCA